MVDVDDSEAQLELVQVVSIKSDYVNKVTVYRVSWYISDVNFNGDKPTMRRKERFFDTSAKAHDFIQKLRDAASLLDINIDPLSAAIGLE